MDLYGKQDYGGIMDYNIIDINRENYHMFDDMIYWRIHGKERSNEEKDLNKGNQLIPDELSNDHFFLHAVEVDDKLIGWISLIFLPKVGRNNFKGFVYVDELWIEPSYRRRGLAKLLMAKADDLSYELEAVGIRLGVNVNNPGAKTLYENCGYENTGQAYTMEKR